jgi:uncharacterized cupin superfamily protein
VKHRSESHSSRAVIGVLLCVVWFTAPLAAVAGDAKSEQGAAIAPVVLDRAKLGGVGLAMEEAFIDPGSILAGKSTPRGAVLFRGEDLVVEIYEDDEVKMRVTEPFAHDEFIYIMSGELMLTDASGAESNYVAGDSLVIPKEFTGIWHMRGNFRELVVIERKVYDATYPSE